MKHIMLVVVICMPLFLVQSCGGGGTTDSGTDTTTDTTTTDTTTTDTTTTDTTTTDTTTTDTTTTDTTTTDTTTTDTTTTDTDTTTTTTINQPSLSINDVTTTNESSSTYSSGSEPYTGFLTVTLSAASTETITVDYASSNGTATSGSDYTATSGTLTFSANDTSETITVPVLSDHNEESDETVILTLSNASNASISDATGILTIHEGTLSVTSPNGGESWTVGESQTISWTTTDADIARYHVSIELYKSGSLIGEIAETSGDDFTDWMAGSGSYTWTIPSSLNGTNISGSNYKVKITSTADSGSTVGGHDWVAFQDVNDQSNANFTISAN
jgi:hypothetical protein